MGNIDLIGERFGRLVVVGEDGVRKGTRYLGCLCDCGKTHVAGYGNLKSGRTRSCGCLNREALSARATHGMEGTRVYRIWRGMKERCKQLGVKFTKNYGDRGIEVCERWYTSFENFLADMGEPPTDKHSIDRKNTNGHYEPGNCRWATQAQQGQNTRVNKLDPFKVCNIRYLKASGVQGVEISERYGVSPAIVSKIVRNEVWKGFMYSDKPVVKTPSIFKPRAFA